MEVLPTNNEDEGKLSNQNGLSWFAIFRLGLVQVALGSIVVLTTSTLNRVMVVELGLAAIVPGVLVGLHYGVQISRPLWGHSSDNTQAKSARTRWIIGGMGLLSLAGIGAAATTLLFESSFVLGMAFALLAFTLIGFGIGACGTSLLALLASRTRPERRPAAASMVWIMMIAGIIITAGGSGANLDPYSHTRLVVITAIVSAIAFTLTCLAIAGIEAKSAGAAWQANINANAPTFKESLAEVWTDSQARIFTIFVFISMLAYFTQDLILEPFGGLLFGLTAGETTKLTGVQHQGVLLGMICVGLLGSMLAKRKKAILKVFVVAGCFGSAISLAALSMAAQWAPAWPLELNIFALGFANGMFAVAAIGTMMTLAGEGKKSKEGIRMGVWGAAQAVAAGLGGFAGTVLLDLMRWVTATDTIAFSSVFFFEALLFIVSAIIAFGFGVKSSDRFSGDALSPEITPAE